MGNVREPAANEQAAVKPVKRRANDLTGKAWTALSISVWSDIRRTPEERKLRHPAMFPVMLIERLIRCFMTDEQKVVLDPFVGSGAVLVACQRLGKSGIGFEISEKFARIARRRLLQKPLMVPSQAQQQVILEDARRLGDFVPDETVDFCVTSPPYWDVLSRPRTADKKTTRDYGQDPRDLGRICDYETFLGSLAEVFGCVYRALKPGSYFVFNVMDLRKKSEFFPLHTDVVPYVCRQGFEFDDLIIWDRSAEYNNLRPLGYPYVFRINKVHEYLLIFAKPRT